VIDYHNFRRRIYTTIEYHGEILLVIVGTVVASDSELYLDGGDAQHLDILINIAPSSE
jgi:hypothetical protein